MSAENAPHLPEMPVDTPVAITLQFHGKPANHLPTEPRGGTLSSRPAAAERNHRGANAKEASILMARKVWPAEVCPERLNGIFQQTESLATGARKKNAQLIEKSTSH